MPESSAAKDGILILGATGPTGTLVAGQLGAAGQSIAVILRTDTRRDEFAGMGAQVIAADAMDRDSIFAGLESAASCNCGTVLNLLGGNPFQEPATWPDHVGVVNTTDAAIAAGIQRYVLVTSVGTGTSMQYLPADAYIRPILALKNQAEAHLKKTSLDWTIIKPGGLGPPDYKIKRGNPLISENHGLRGLIDRSDLAEVILRVLATPIESTLHRELYVVADRIEMHAGTAEPYPLPDAIPAIDV